ncbi:single-stranded DNA-binding protein [Pseudonocardia sp. HH130629-09]|uniref:single-stranded DNA-binding protein n=1 Tax=Pseudonocardia sp. HH130629-09 TaxID=1641402 RepID=UPI00143C81CF|nr:single-stranded DNA-binding protein [Pseudonocardia sp. HH130629-09]
MSDNTATIVGNLTRTPVLRYTANNIPVTDLMVAGACLVIGVSASLLSRSRLPASGHRT